MRTPTQGTFKSLITTKKTQAERLTHALNISVHEYLNHAIQTATYESEYKRACHTYDIIFTNIYMKKEGMR